MEGFKFTDIGPILGMKRSTLLQWVELGYARPSVQRATGTRKPHIFSLVDLYHIALFQRLLALGFQREQVGTLLCDWDFGKLVKDKCSRIVFDVGFKYHPNLVGDPTWTIHGWHHFFASEAQRGGLPYVIPTMADCKVTIRFDRLVDTVNRNIGIWDEIKTKLKDGTMTRNPRALEYEHALKKKRKD